MADPMEHPEPRATRLHERIDALLDMHKRLYKLDGPLLCTGCGVAMEPTWDAWRAHLASELERVVLEERQEWLRERARVEAVAVALKAHVEQVIRDGPMAKDGWTEMDAWREQARAALAVLR